MLWYLSEIKGVASDVIDLHLNTSIILVCILPRILASQACYQPHKHDSKNFSDLASRALHLDPWHSLN